MINILCTGSPDDLGIAQAIKQIFPNTTFISRRTGCDLTTEDGLSYFRSIIKNYNVFINNAQISLGTQEILLRIVNNEWQSGHVFNIGSIIEFEKWSWIDPPVSAEKLQLRDLSIEMCNERFKTTHLTVGGFQDKCDIDKEKLDPIEIALLIKWIIEQPYHIPHLFVDKITDARTARWANLNPNI